MDDRSTVRTGTGISRRRLLRLSAGALAVGASAGLGDVTATRAAAGPGFTRVSPGSIFGVTSRAIQFLNTMMDAYNQGSTPRLAQSYSDQSGLNSTAFTYDNALQIIAYLSRGWPDDRERAGILGDSLLYAQAHDPNYSDGRLRDSYFVAPSLIPVPGGPVQLDGAPAYLNGSSVGNMAWAGLALVHLYRSIGAQRYLDGALKLGSWIVTNAYSTNGPGGYTGGFDNGQHPLTYKATEHNIDVYAFFRLLSQLTGDQVYPGLSQPWFALSAHAAAFLALMWNPAGPYFFTGTNPDGVTINPSPVPEDAQTWSFLALGNPAYAQSLDWARGNLATTDTPQSYNSTLTGLLTFSGVTFSNVSRHPGSLLPPNGYTPGPDPDGVWFEGTAHLITALLARNGPGEGDAAHGADIAGASDLLRNLIAAQAQLGQNQKVGGNPIANGNGLVAASSPLDTGYFFDYFPNLHIGATSWYVLAARQVNPFQLDRD